MYDLHGYVKQPISDWNLVFKKCTLKSILHSFMRLKMRLSQCKYTRLSTCNLHKDSIFYFPSFISRRSTPSSSTSCPDRFSKTSHKSSKNPSRSRASLPNHCLARLVSMSTIWPSLRLLGLLLNSPVYGLLFESRSPWNGINFKL